ncbi:DUF4330 domain-containing protein [Aneurinibacillus aneurinilyticus]|uniref:DUF4330 domain-containing protein n=1 Tax=Aneurinibacillus aneurinilyticus TaxID=1391 RepID=UPI003523B114
MIDEKGKVWGIINLIDFLLFLILLFGIVFIGVKMMQPNEIVQQKKEVTYSLYNSTEYAFIVNRIKKGDILRNQDNGDILGEVISVKTQPGKVITTKSDGTMTISQVPDKSSVIITLKTKAKVKGTDLEQGNIPLLRGAKVKIKGPSYSLETVINDVSS